jgi:hypothetical protein
MHISRVFHGFPVALGLLALAIFAPAASATALDPGQSVCASGCTFTPIQDFGAGFFFTGPIDSTGPLAFTANSGTFSGTLEEWVAEDVNTGGLDFLYQVVSSTSSADAIEHISVTGYNGFTTDAGFCSNPGGGQPVPCGNPLGGANGTLAPSNITRSSGSTIDFSFLTGGIAPGVTTYDLVVQTNATAYGLVGTANLIDGGVASMTTFAPTTATPEPASAGLFLGGLAGVGMLVARRFCGQQS